MDQVLFCPFCGEAFEAQARCPAHDLRLVPWHTLADRSRSVSETDPMPWQSLRLGRGWLAVGAALTLLAFIALPLAEVDGALHMSGSMLRLALQRAPRLWLVPAAATAQMMVLYRRRSAHALRAARVAAALVACVPTLVVAFTWFGAREAVALLAERLQQPLHIHIGPGAVVIAVAGAVMLVGALRLGVVGDSKPIYD
jgi:hypothetical protein